MLAKAGELPLIHPRQIRLLDEARDALHLAQRLISPGFDLPFEKADASALLQPALEARELVPLTHLPPLSGQLHDM